MDEIKIRLLRQLGAVLKGLDRQEARLERDAELHNMSVGDMRDRNGRYMLNDILVAKAYALSAIAHLRGVDK